MPSRRFASQSRHGRSMTMAIGGRLVATKIWMCGGGWALVEWGCVGRGWGGRSAEVVANGVEVPGVEWGRASRGGRWPRTGWKCWEENGDALLEEEGGGA
jgi:hypothetical protein